MAAKKKLRTRIQGRKSPRAAVLRRASASGRTGPSTITVSYSYWQYLPGLGNYVEFFGFQDENNGNGLNLDGTRGQTSIAWQSQSMFILLFENATWIKYLRRLPGWYLAFANGTPAAYVAQEIAHTGVYRLRFDVLHPGPLQAGHHPIAVQYTIIPFCPRQQIHPLSTLSNNTSRATIILQD